MVFTDEPARCSLTGQDTEWYKWHKNRKKYLKRMTARKRKIDGTKMYAANIQILGCW